jgi:amino acid adenylation domain-containing protein
MDCAERTSPGNSQKDTQPVPALVTQWLTFGMEQAADQSALVFGSRVVSHRELDGFSNNIAHYLVRRGVKRGDRVGICLDRSIEMVAAIIGILKAGAAYVPLDPAYPTGRLSMMQEDARLRLLFVHAAHAERFPQAGETLTVWEMEETKVLREPAESLDIDIDPEDVAYVIFTSGSTGRPKGIAMPHRALANLIEWELERKTFKPAARVLQYSSISFDASFEEIGTTLASGGVLYLVSDSDRKDPRVLLRTLVDQRIERLFLPYVAMRSMIEAAHVVGTYPIDLKEIITAGEQLRVDDGVRDFFKRIEGSSLDNQYGPSETHVITAHLLEGDPVNWPDLPPIGLTLKNNETYILDEDMQPVGPGDSGELYLAGRNLAHGYIHRKDLTQKVFLHNPFGGDKWPVFYKSGDLASYNEDGSINFLGRRDHQIKIRGYRIEPGEINNTASGFPDIEHCLTHAFSGADHVLKLITYYTVSEGGVVERDGLHRHLLEKLPEYMVPAFLVEIDGIPYTPSGKVDLKALPKPSLKYSRYAGEEISYETETEARLGRIWGELLELGDVPRNADFFELGGDSLRAVTLLLNIRQTFGVDLPVESLATASTVAELARLVDSGGDAGDFDKYRSLKMLQRGQAGHMPLFLIHDGAGSALMFANFANSLGEQQPVYAFQWSGWDGRKGDRTLPQMAQRYKEELMDFYPDGAVMLFGFCAGGMIALELAGLLEQEGREIAWPVLVWDTPNLRSPAYCKQEPWDDAESAAAYGRMLEEFRQLKRETMPHLPPVPAPNFSLPSGMIGRLRLSTAGKWFMRTVRKVRKYSRTMSERLKFNWMLARGKKIPMEFRKQYCRNTVAPAYRRYKPTTYSGDVLYLRSGRTLGRNFELSGWWSDPLLGFRELCKGNFKAIVVGGAENGVSFDVPEMSDAVKEQLLACEKKYLNGV